MAGIVTIQLGRLEKLLADRQIKLDVAEDALQWLATAGYDPAYGARPLKRVIQRELQNRMAEELLAGKIHDGDTVRVTVEDGDLAVRSAGGAAPDLPEAEAA